MRNRLLRTSLVTLSLIGCARSPHPSLTPVATVAPQPKDVETLDGLMRAFYEVVNVAPDGPRQWSRDRTLYVPWIRFVATGMSPSGRPEVEVWDHQRLVDETEPLVRKGFREREIHRTQSRYGNIVHIDSTYEAEHGPEGKATRSRGVNSLEVFFDGNRWWIASVMWMYEDADHPIPPHMLPSYQVAF